MKKTILLFLFMALTRTYSKADTPLSTVIDGTTFYFVINDDGETATITNEYDKDEYNGTGRYGDGHCSYSGDVVIPSTVDYEGKSYNVTKIGELAFYSYYSESPILTSVVIPEGVTEIGTQAFYFCTSLISVTIPASVTYIGVSAFNSCSSLTTVELPQNSNLTSFEEFTFSMCESLKFISIPKKIESINHGAFICCSKLESVDIPEGVKYIGETAFNGCGLLSVVIIPESVTEIGTEAFAQCIRLYSIYIKGTTMPEISEDAFWGVGTYCYLFVYEGMKEAYLNAVGKCFYDSDHIVELSADQFPSAIPTVTTTTKSVVGYYDLSGRKLTAPTGVTIIRYSDGTAEKILAK